MRSALLLVATGSLAGAGCQAIEPAPPPFTGKTCSGVELEVVEQAVAPPANVSVRLRASGCGGAALTPPLDQSHFEIVEDGRVTSAFEARREVRAATRDGVSLTLLALDLSGSVVRAGLRPAMVAGARKLVHAITPEHRVGIFGFDGRPDLVPYAYFTSDVRTLDQALDRLETDPLVDDSTNLYGAVVNGLGVLDSVVASEARDPRLVAQGALVVFTDGSDRASRVPASKVESTVAGSPHATLAIGVGGEIDPDTLDLIGKTAHAVAADQNAIAGAFDEIAARLRARTRQDFIVDYCSPSRAGSHILDIRVSREALSGDARIEFSAEGFGAGCDPQDSPLR